MVQVQKSLTVCIYQQQQRNPYQIDFVLQHFLQYNLADQLGIPVGTWIVFKATETK